jgi:hypothetical protein
VLVAELTVIYWRDIPAQVTASDGDRNARVELGERFQQAIDAAAMEAGLIASDAYLEEWRTESRACGIDLEREAADEAERLESSHAPEALYALVRAGGHRGGGDR